MKILLINRADLLEKFGGDSIKTLKTKEYLEKNGIKVDLMLGNQKDVDFRDYDLVHIFNLQNIKLTPWWIKKAKLGKKPIVLSTIWWRAQNTIKYLYKIYREYHPRHKRYPKYHPRHYLSLKFLEKIWGESLSLKIFQNLHKLRFFYKERYSVKNVDRLITESNSEIEEMASYFNIPDLFKKSTIIPNGISEEFIKNQIIEINLTKNLPKDFVLTVGRIDPIKNQLNILKALIEEKEIPLVFVGSKTGPISYEGYIKEFEVFSKKRRNVYWFDNVPQSQLKEFYQKARVYCQPSVWETLGMTIFEAALFGCNLVITTEGGAKDYFKDKAFYCDPFDLNSIKKAILLALKSPKNNRLQNYVKENFTWDKIALKILEVYQEVLSTN